MIRNRIQTAPPPSPRHRATPHRTYMPGFARKALAAAGLLLTILTGPAAAQTNDAPPVIEVVTLTLKNGVTPAQFAPVDRAIQVNYVSRQPGFISRESAHGDNHRWLVIVHWRTAAAADASMKRFAAAPGTARWMSMVVPDSMMMTRYGK